MTELELIMAAHEWIDANSGEETWRFVRLVDREVLWPSHGVRVSGFLFDGPGFYAPRFKSWDDQYSDFWQMLARRRARKVRV